MSKDPKLFQHGSLAMLVAGLFDGTVDALSGDVKTPFACVHFDPKTPGQKISGLSLPEFEGYLKGRGIKNVFYAVKLTGRFAKMKTRTVFKQKKPYPGLSEVADQQAIFKGENTTSTLIGYYAPDLYQGIASSDFHLHYLSADLASLNDQIQQAEH